jgi:DNA repair protein RecN (Recombination protein N)
MLEELSVLNYALIDRVHVRFSRGLNVLTGETGAGKSILVGALGLLLGQKADTSVIRAGADETVVNGVVNVAGNGDALAWLSAHGIEAEDGSIILRRVIKRSGRGAAFVQSAAITRADLQELASLLFDYHGQHEHQSLLDVANHLRLLDRFGGVENLSGEVASLFQSWSAARARLAKLVASERERLREIDLLAFAVKEINEAALSPDEEERIEAEHRVLSNHEKLFRLLEEVHELLAASGTGALAALRRSREAMEDIAQIDPALAKASHQLQDAFFEIEDFGATVRGYLSEDRFDPARFAQVETRLALIHGLKRKYGDSVADVLAYRDRCASELAALENWEGEKEKLSAEIQQLARGLHDRAAELSQKRKAAAAELQRQVEAELGQLGMSKARFGVLVQPHQNDDGKPAVGPHGLDDVEFVIAPNVGEPPKRLRLIASGGELSRVMLAIKSVLVESDHISTLIFDEVDTGVGGQVALAVGERLARLASSKQLLCITHLATIAVRADNHLRVEKAESGGRTLTRVDTVKADRQAAEIARMLSGDAGSETSLHHARELMERYGA